MTLAELSALSDDQLNVMLAECEGWRVHSDGPPDHIYLGLHPRMHQPDDAPIRIPRYCSDLNETARVEEGLTWQQLMEWERQLEELCWWIDGESQDGRVSLIRATARQRTIALIATKKGIQ